MTVLLAAQNILFNSALFLWFCRTTFLFGPSGELAPPPQHTHTLCPFWIWNQGVGTHFETTEDLESRANSCCVYDCSVSFGYFWNTEQQTHLWPWKVLWDMNHNPWGSTTKSALFFWDPWHKPFLCPYSGTSVGIHRVSLLIRQVCVYSPLLLKRWCSK